ncbi:hypothetical protein HanXRQr2_Chr04g0142751 [Helianthus annuus]|uniref:Uncharacterized protein n=1 Tax=Helianthus annuus TaxID=4232 RepID=A0A9K3J4C3_HELAN|nr:hypothetical protein HanXRQr2_Chr04g0142751 [Helianthus annuus]KAJ0929533.1 hypothetical protein HanPSC8_Chr04g0138731 [Helianthus annuus]
MQLKSTHNILPSYSPITNKGKRKKLTFYRQCFIEIICTQEENFQVRQIRYS